MATEEDLPRNVDIVELQSERVAHNMDRTFLAVLAGWFLFLYYLRVHTHTPQEEGFLDSLRKDS